MRRGLVSIIMPVYNAQSYLIRSIDSVLNQTYSDFELIIINDGSTDNTVKILESIEDSRIKKITIENGGPSKARNVGLREANGEYIQFIDADDFLNDDSVEYLVKKISQCDMVIASYNTIRDNIVNVKRVEHEQYLSGKDIANNYLDMFKTQIIRHLWNKMYLKVIIDENNLKFDEKLKRGEGIVFNLNYLKHVQKVFLSEKSIYNYYNDNSESITSNYLYSFVDNSEIVFKHIINYLEEFAVGKTYIDKIYNFYIDRLIAYIGLLFSSRNKVKKGLIIEQIKLISNNRMFREHMETYTAPTKKRAFLVFLLRNRMTTCIYIYYKLKFK